MVLDGAFVSGSGWAVCVCVCVSAPGKAIEPGMATDAHYLSKAQPNLNAFTSRSGIPWGVVVLDHCHKTPKRSNVIP